MTRKSVTFARKLREHSTDAERLFWSSVRARRLLGFRFKRQAPLGCYIVDFVCTEAKLIVELDGGHHADSETDLTRDERLRDQGYRVLRFWNNEVLLNLSGTLEVVAKHLKKPSPCPLPQPGEGTE